MDKRGAVVVTGAASGIGAATAKLLAARGESLALIDIDRARLKQIASTLPRALSVAVDVSDRQAVDDAFDDAARHFGSLHGLAHIAGLDPQPEIKSRLAEHMEAMAGGSTRLCGELTLALTDEQWRQVVQVNLDGTFYCVRAALRHMVPQESGAIVTVSSQAGVSGIGGLSHYSASKAGVIGYSQAVAREVAPIGIRVNCVAPGAVNTPMRRRNPEYIRSATDTTSPIGRVADPSELAAVISFLLSDEASFIIGETVNVNGGTFIA